MSDSAHPGNAAGLESNVERHPAGVPVVFPDQILVSTPYLEAVLRRLQKLGVPPREDLLEHNSGLGLTRIFLAQGVIDKPPSEYQDFRKMFDVGLVLKRLREEFARDNAGWFPTMGKNRGLADNIIGGGSMIYGGLDQPEIITGEELSEVNSKWTAYGNGRPSEPGHNVRIGVVDTRIMVSQPLEGALRVRREDLLGPHDLTERAGHATFVAGVILSVAPGSRLEVRGILSNNGVADSWEAAKAIVELGASGVDILNLSFGCTTGDGLPTLALATAIDMVDPRTVVVAAAGNHALGREGVNTVIDGRVFTPSRMRRCASYPAALDNVVAVGSVEGDQVAEYSPYADWVDVFADGTNVESTYLHGLRYEGFARWTGTSFAAAIVSGAIAAETKPGYVTSREAWEIVRNRSRTEILGLASGSGSSAAGTPGGPAPTMESRVIRPKKWFDS